MSHSIEFSSYHMKCINSFRWTALSRSIISWDSINGYSVRPSPVLAQLWFYLYLINTFAKLVFLLLLITGYFGPIEFLDRICGLDYLLCGGMVCIAYLIWQQYPLYEIIHRLWEVENRIFTRLGRPRELKWEAQEQHSITVWAHVFLTCLGCCSLVIQFYMAPKYCVFTYSLFDADNAYLRIIFCFHEVLFLSHAWSAMACSNGLCSFEAVNLSLVINHMTKAIDKLTSHQTVSVYKTDNILFVNYGHQEIHSETVVSATETKEEQQHHNLHYSRETSGSMSSRIGGTFQFRRILYDFQQLMLVSEQFNYWVGYKLVGLSICAFCQYISSTTMAFQVLKIPGTGIGDIWFYIQDCTVAVYVTFRVFEFMSIVLPASEQFLTSVRRYLAAKSIIGGHTHKFQKVLRPVSLKLGPNPLNRENVLDTMEMLASYYVCVALW